MILGGFPFLACRFQVRILSQLLDSVGFETYLQTNLRHAFWLISASRFNERSLGRVTEFEQIYP